METRSVLSQDFWNTPSVVPLDGYAGERLWGAEQSNKVAQTAWLEREKFPVPWLHTSFRWRLLRLLPHAYADEANIAPSTVNSIERGREDIGNLRFHTSFHHIHAFWSKKISAESNDDERRQILENGLELLCTGLTTHTRLQVNTLLLRERIEAGPEKFENRTGLLTDTMRARVTKERLTGFGELTGYLRRLHYPRPSRTPMKWADDRVQSALQAFLDDAVSQGWRREHAMLWAVVEFAGISFSTQDLSAQAHLPQRVVQAITANQAVPLSELSPLLHVLKQKITSDAIDALQGLWPRDVHCVELPAFAPLIRNNMSQLHIDNAALVDACQLILPTSQRPSDAVRTCLERGPSRAMPVATLFYLTAHSQQGAGVDALAGMHAELSKRASQNFREADPDLHAALQLYGLPAQEVFQGDDLHRFRELRAGKISTMKKADALSCIRSTGLRKKILPALRRYVANLEPTSLVVALRLLAGSRKGSFNTLAHDGDTSAETLHAVDRGEIMPPPVTLETVFRAQNVEMPAIARMEMHLRYAQCYREEGQAKSAGAALHAIMGRTHRFPREFFRQKKIHCPETTMSGRLRRACKEGCVEAEHVKEILKAIDMGDDSPCASYLQRIQTGKDANDVLPEWIEQMRKEERSELLIGLEDLIQSFVKRESRMDKGTPPSEEELHSLLQRKFLLQRWLAGELNEGETVDEPHHERALAALLQLPGVTATELRALVPHLFTPCAPVVQNITPAHTSVSKGTSETIRVIPDFATVRSWLVKAKRLDLWQTYSSQFALVNSYLELQLLANNGAVSVQDFQNHLCEKLAQLKERK